jgi:hypothetical protein
MEKALEIIMVFLANPHDFAINSDAVGGSLRRLTNC